MQKIMTTVELLMMIGDHFHDCFTVVDANTEARLCIYVNQVFCRHTGYSREEAIGSNLKFLQGDDTDVQTIQFMHESFAMKSASSVDILNYRKDGSTFVNRLVMLPIERDDQLFYLGFQNVIDAAHSPNFTGSLGTNGEINHVLNNNLTAIVMELELATRSGTPIDQAIKNCAETFLEINRFARHIDDPTKFRTYNPFHS